MVTRILLSLLLLLWVAPLAAAQLTAELEKKQSLMGEPLYLSITSAASLNELDLTPLRDDFEVFSQAATSSKRKGREQSVLEITLYPLRSGKLVVPSLALDTARSRPLPVEILPTNVTLLAWLTPEVPLEREPSTLHLEIRDDGSLTWTMPTQLDAPHITLRPLPEEISEEVSAGVINTTHHYRWRVLPLKNGSLSIGFGMLSAFKFGQRLRFPMHAISFRVQGAPAYLPLQLPIGQPTLHMDAPPKIIIAGQPMAWNLYIHAPGLSPEGALKLLRYDTPPGLRFYAPSVTSVTLDGKEALRLTLSFVGDSDAEIFPALRLAYFDPQKQRIEALTIPATQLTVRLPLREKFLAGALLVESGLLLSWLGFKAWARLQRLRIKRAWLTRIQTAADPASLYRALTQEAPWRASTLQHWPESVPIDRELRTQLELARFSSPQSEIVFVDLKQAWLRACGHLPLLIFPKSVVIREGRTDTPSSAF